MVLGSSVCYHLYLLFVLWLLTGTFKLNLHHEFENEALNFIKSDHLFAGCYPLDSLFRDLFDHTLMRRRHIDAQRRTGVALPVAFIIKLFTGNNIFKSNRNR